MAKVSSIQCVLCGRERPLTFHHLIPRTLHSNKWFKKRFDRETLQAGIDVCRDCHSTIHRHLGEKELGREFNTREKLLAHPEIRAFVTWIAGRDIGRVATRGRRRR